MAFDDIPEDRCEAYPCPKCEVGTVRKDKNGHWFCSKCAFERLVESVKKAGEAFKDCGIKINTAANHLHDAKEKINDC